MKEPSDAQRTETVAPETARPWTGAPQLAPGTVVGARYELRGVLGSGGSAVVYRAHDRLLKREIALKVLRPDRLTPNALVRLRREATAARDVAHPNLIRVFDLEAADGLMFLAMELVEGESLRQRLRAGPLAVEEAVRIGTGVLRGLSALHDAGLVHRDVKPGNVLLGTDGAVKLADLGLVRRWERDETRATESEAVIGTFEYLSPEQAMGEELDARSDLYSAGVVLFEMLAGRLPHEGRSSLGTLLASLRAPVPSLRRLRDSVPEWLSALVAHLLERERGQRYASAAEAAADLEARRSPLAGRRRLRRRNLGRSIAAIIVLGALGGAFAGYRAVARQRFAAVVEDGPTRVRGIDHAGRTLWTRPGWRPALNYVPLRRAEGAATLLAAFTELGAIGPTPDRLRIDLVEPQTGSVRKRLTLPEPGSHFEGMANLYARELTAWDLDGDGADELLVTYIHSPYWPSYTVLCEPAPTRCRTVFLAAGHHRPAGLADVDGDGRNEILFGGISNRLGHYLGIAAVRVEPWLGAHGLEARFELYANSPDAVRSAESATALAWYALLPPVQHGNFEQPFGVDPARRRIRVKLMGTATGTAELDFDGFSTDAVSTRAPSERQRARAASYESLRRATRLQGARQLAEAWTSAREAVAFAELAEDGVLLEWARTVAGGLAVAAGETAWAQATFERAFPRAANPAAIAWQAATSYHLAGGLDAAIDWYRRGLAVQDQPQRGRNVHEFLEHLTFALGEQGRWEEAGDDLARWSRSFEALIEESHVLQVWLDWRRGRPVARATFGERAGDRDFVRYLRLELDHRAGDDPGSLLPRVRSATTLAPAAAALLESLEAELLAALGRHAEARAAAREALEHARRDANDSLLVRAHFALVEERARHQGV